MHSILWTVQSTGNYNLTQHAQLPIINFHSQSDHKAHNTFSWILTSALASFTNTWTTSVWPRFMAMIRAVKPSWGKSSKRKSTQNIVISLANGHVHVDSMSLRWCLEAQQAHYDESNDFHSYLPSRKVRQTLLWCVCSVEIESQLAHTYL